MCHCEHFRSLHSLGLGSTTARKLSFANQIEDDTFTGVNSRLAVKPKTPLKYLLLSFKFLVHFVWLYILAISKMHLGHAFNS